MAEGILTDLSAWTRPTAVIPGGTQPALFGPGQPVLPLRPEDAPRVFQYQPGVNLVSLPRAGFGLTNFQSLRNLAMACKEIRLNIELIKRELRALDWEIVPTQKTAGFELNADPAIEFFQQPDGLHDFDQWLNLILEEMLSIDAITLWPELDRGGRLLSMEVIAGDTFRPLLDFRGRIPRPPAPAYIQVLHGLPTSYFARDRLIYRPFNTAANSPYGASPIEFIILAVNLALRRDSHYIAVFTEGNVPEALVGAPSSWDQNQVDTWQRYWDAMVAGNTAAQRKMHFVPLEGGRGQVPVYEFRPKDDANQTARDEWLMRVACWAYGNSPAEFGITSGEGLGGAGYMSGMENIQYRSMLGPVSQYLNRLFDHIISDWLRLPWLEFRWKGLEPQEDKLQQAQVDQLYLQSGVYNLAYVQERLGIPMENRPAEAPLPTISPLGGGAGGGFFRADGSGSSGGYP